MNKSNLLSHWKEGGIKLLGALAAAIVLTPAPSWGAGTLNVYNWAEYIGETTIADFAKEYNIEVTYDNYDSVEMADSKPVSYTHLTLPTNREV